jgi:hypothetical protein
MIELIPYSGLHIIKSVIDAGATIRVLGQRVHGAVFRRGRG